jgi:MFS family permease
MRTSTAATARAGVLAERDFRLLFAGQTLSTVGDAAATIAVAFAVLEIGGSASALGAVLAARYLPQAAFLLIGGVVADRLPRRGLMLTSDAVRALSQGILAALLLSGSAQLWQIVLLQAVYGTSAAFFSPALAGLVPLLVREDRLQQANALLRMTFDLAVIVGPGLGALLVARFEAGGAVAADAGTFAVSALLLTRLRPGRRAPGRRHRIRLVADLREGWSEVRSRSWLWVSIGNFTFFSAFAWPGVLVLGPELARTQLGGIGAWSILVGAFGVGALAGSIASLRARYVRPAAAVGLLLAFAAARPGVYASGAALPLIAAFSCAAGAAMSTASILWVAMLQQNLPQDRLSRVNSIDSFGTMLLMPVGYATAGPLASAVGLQLGMVLFAAVPLLVSLATLASFQVRNLRWVQPAAPEPEPGGPARVVAAEPACEPSG